MAKKDHVCSFNFYCKEIQKFIDEGRKKSLTIHTTKEMAKMLENHFVHQNVKLTLTNNKKLGNLYSFKVT